MIKLKYNLPVIILIAGLFVGLFFLVSQSVLAQTMDNSQNTASIDKAVEQEVAADEDVTPDDLGVSDPKILPDSPLYFFKNLWRGIRSTFTFNPVKKVELRLRYADERLIEAKKLAQKTGKDEIFEKTLENYQDDIDSIKNRAEKLKEKAKDNPRISKFLDKLTDRTIKQQKLMDKFEEKFADKPEVLNRIKNARERALEHFGKVISRLEEKDKIPQRIERSLDKIKGSRFKHFKNLEILMELENKVPKEAKEAIKRAEENALKRLHGNLEQMSPQDQEKFSKYLDRIKGDQTEQLEILKRLKKRIKNPLLRKRIEANKEKIGSRIINFKENLLRLCPEMPKSATIEEIKKCILKKRAKKRNENNEENNKEDNNKEDNKEESSKRFNRTGAFKRMVCPMIWAPVCGKDGRTYGNACLAKINGTEVAYRGKCNSERFMIKACGPNKIGKCYYPKKVCTRNPRTGATSCGVMIARCPSGYRSIGPDICGKTRSVQCCVPVK